MRGLIALLLAVAGMAGASVNAEAATPPPGATDMGGVNLTYYCQHSYGGNYKSAVLGSTAYDWRCVPKIHHAGAVNYPISVTGACLLQYRLPGLQAVALNDNDPTSWRCFRGGHGIHPL